MTDDLFDEESIRASFVAIATRLEELDADAGLLIVVGGSFMALHGLRDSTHDVDTVNRISASIRAAAAEVAHARGFEPDWLNDRAAGFAPVGLDEDECEVFYEHPRLRVLGPPPDYVFLMKLYAARGGPDHDDMVALWPRCTFTSAEDAASRFAAAYPHAPTDPHLAGYITAIKDEAASSG